MKTWRTWWEEWSSILKVVKVKSLQCLYNTSKKKLWMEFLTFYVSYRFFIKVARHVQSTEKRKLLNFSNIFRKFIATVFVFYCDAKHSDTWLGSSNVCCYLFLGGCGQKTGCGLLDHESLKSDASQESELIKWTDLFACWYKFKKANVNLVIIWWTWSKVGMYKV